MLRAPAVCKAQLLRRSDAKHALSNNERCVPLCAQALYEQCYAHVVAVLRYLVDPGAAGAEGERLAKAAALSPDERAGFLKTLLARAGRAEDPGFREALYTTLVDLRATRELLQLDSPALERHLRAAGGLPERGALAVGAPIGPLGPAQARAPAPSESPFGVRALVGL